MCIFIHCTETTVQWCVCRVCLLFFTLAHVNTRMLQTSGRFVRVIRAFSNETALDYRSTLNLPVTSFSLRSKAAIKEESTQKVLNLSFSSPFDFERVYTGRKVLFSL